MLCDVLTGFGALRAAVGLRALFATAVFRPAAFLLTPRFGVAARGATRFFADFLLLAALRVAAVRLAAAVVVFRAAVFFTTFLATRFRAGFELLLARFTACFRLPLAEPFRFAITRSFRNVRNQQLP